jgi:hypothetical protein
VVTALSVSESCPSDVSRHASAVLAGPQNSPVASRKTAKVRLGHADPRTTQRIYAQATEKADREAAKKVGERSSTITERRLEGFGVGLLWLGVRHRYDINA